MSRFFHPELLKSLDSGELLLEGSEAHHALHVLRVKTGQQIVLFDGQGNSATANVIRPGRKDVGLRIVGDIQHSSPLALQLTLLVATPKGDRLDWMVEKLTELGVSRFVPLITQRSVVDPRESKLEKLRQTVISACKQSHRDWLMEIEEPLRLTEWLNRKDHPNQWFGSLQAPLVAQGALNDSQPIVSANSHLPVENRSLAILIGPEGGWTSEEESQLMTSGARPVRLGQFVLRTETAAMALTTLALNEFSH